MTEWGGRYVRVAPAEDEWTHEFSIDELVANVYEELVEEYLEVLRRREGVLDAEHADREVIVVSAPGLSAETLGQEADAWFAAAGAETQELT